MEVIQEGEIGRDLSKCGIVVCFLVKRALKRGPRVDQSEAAGTECVAARDKEWLLVIVVIFFHADFAGQ
jgi:hypothetical protein